MISRNELKSIRLLKNKKYRTSERRFLIEGEKNVLELIQSDFEIEKVLVTEKFLSETPTLANTPYLEVVSPKVLTEISTVKTNEKAIAVAVQKDFTISSLSNQKTVFVLDGINDPGNLGTIIRTLDWFGFNQVVCSLDTVEFYNPKVISASMGSFTRVKFFYSDLSDWLASKPETKYGADMDGANVMDWKDASPKIIVMGSESHGIRPEVKTHLDSFLTIPRVGNAESLNVGIATGIICARIASVDL